MIVKGESGESFYVFQLGESLQDAELQIAQLVLDNNEGNQFRAAKALKISYRTMKNWVKLYGLKHRRTRSDQGND